MTTKSAVRRYPMLASLLFAACALAGGDAGATVTRTGMTWLSPTITPDTVFVALGALPATADWQPGDPIREVPRRFFGDDVVPVPTPQRAADPIDPLAALQQAYHLGRVDGFNVPVIDFAGSGFTAATPPDPAGDVGLNHYLQAVNGSGGSRFRIHDKAGALVAGPLSMETLASGTPCSGGFGDPVVLFDEAASRWLLTEFTQSGDALCFYISEFPDPTVAQTWTRYAFSAPNFPDYPKYGVWADAYYVGTNEPGQVPLYAFDRARMLAGLPMSVQRFTAAPLGGFTFQILQPADRDGAGVSPPGAPGIFVRHRDDEAHNPGSNQPTRDFIELFELHVDWTTPANSMLTGPIQIPISEFSSDLNGLVTFNVFPQPSGGRVDSLREPVMFRVAYRSFGSFEQLVGNFVTDTDGQDTGGVRWFELRRTGGIAQPWQLYQEGTVALGDFIDRWMGAIASDKVGNIALAYSTVRDASSHALPETDNVSAGIRYTGRHDGDPVSVMTNGESILHQPASGSQGSNRWGDYHAMNIDPVDDCTFWFTGEHVSGSSWATRIGALRHDNCQSPQFMLNSADLMQTLCVTPSATTLAIDLDVLARNGFVGPVALSLPALPAGMTGSFTPGSVATAGSAVATLTVADPAAATGLHAINLLGTAASRNKEFRVRVDIQNGFVGLLSPAANAFVGATPGLDWSGPSSATGYVLEIATDPAFTSIVYSANVNASDHVVATALATGTPHYWRVAATGGTCADGVFSAPRMFTTQSTSLTSLATDIDPSVYGQPVTMMATVVGSGPVPAGEIAFSDGANQIATVPLDAGGVASFTTSTLTAGVHALTAQYSGSAGYLASVADENHTVQPAAITLVITDAPDPNPRDQETQVTAAIGVTAPGAGAPTGSIPVSASNSTGCTIILPLLQCVLTFDAAGAQTISAAYAGDGNFSGAVAEDIAHEALEAIGIFSDGFEQ